MNLTATSAACMQRFAGRALCLRHAKDLVTRALGSPKWAEPIARTDP